MGDLWFSVLGSPRAWFTHNLQKYLHIICKNIYTQFAKIFTHLLPIRRPAARRAGRAGRGAAAAVTALWLLYIRFHLSTYSQKNEWWEPLCFSVSVAYAKIAHGTKMVHVYMFVRPRTYNRCWNYMSAGLLARVCASSLRWLSYGGPGPATYPCQDNFTIYSSFEDVRKSKLFLYSYGFFLALNLIETGKPIIIKESLG